MRGVTVARIACDGGEGETNTDDRSPQLHVPPLPTCRSLVAWTHDPVVAGSSPAGPPQKGCMSDPLRNARRQLIEGGPGVDRGVSSIFEEGRVVVILDSLDLVLGRRHKTGRLHAWGASYAGSRRVATTRPWQGSCSRRSTTFRKRGKASRSGLHADGRGCGTQRHRQVEGGAEGLRLCPQPSVQCMPPRDRTL